MQGIWILLAEFYMLYRIWRYSLFQNQSIAEAEINENSF